MVVNPICPVQRDRPEDFLVQELSAFEPSGVGDHLALWIVKRNLDHHSMVGRIARAFDVPRRSVGWAGMKDRVAVTQQWITVKTERDFPRQVDSEDLQVLQSARHDRRLRVGHLTGNRFTVRMRGVDPVMAPRAMQSLRALSSTGLPNRFMAQRFGSFARNHLIGAAILQGRSEEVLDIWLGRPDSEDGSEDAIRRTHYEEGRWEQARQQWPASWTPERQALRLLSQGTSAAKTVSSVPRSVRMLWTDALQSFCFNAVVDRREAEGSLHSLLEGDISWSHDRLLKQMGEPPRPAVATGPLWGRRMRGASGHPHEIECASLAPVGLEPTSFQGPDAPKGARRPLLAPVLGTRCSAGFDEHGSWLEIGFDLPKGSYATAVEQRIIAAL